MTKQEVAGQPPGQWTIGAILNWTRQYFDAKGVDNPRLDAEVLLSHVLGKERLYLYVHFDQPLEKQELTCYRDAVRRRAGRSPVAYITGVKEFMGLEFAVSPAVLIPRPDTEILVEAAISRLKPVAQPEIADLGTGSGAVIISALHHLPEAAGVAVDISTAALTVAKVNGGRYQLEKRLEFKEGDLFAPLARRKFDAILSNPPYIPNGDIAGLAPEVRQEPKLALAGGHDGLSFYRRIVGQGAGYLKAGGFIAVETGMGQAAPVAALAAGTGELEVESVLKDYAGIERVVVFRRTEGRGK